MSIIELKEIRSTASIKVNKITRIVDDISDLEKAISDLQHLKLHAGEMIFTGNSGRIGEREVMLKTVKINTLGGCVAVPDLLLELARNKLKELEKSANEIISSES